MEQKLIKISFNSKIQPVKPINEQLTLCKCYVMALGENDNRTIISKESVDDALPTLFNVPVVGHIYADEDGVIRMGGHDIALEKDADGKYIFKSITVPYGTVPQQDNVHYVEVEEGGKKKTYLVADTILWTGRYPELLDAAYSEDTYFAQSMEIIPSETEKTEAGLNIKKFQFSALCLLGKSDDRTKNVVPCFKSAKVEPYKFSETGKWIELFSEFKEQLAKSYSAENVGKGGKELNTETIKKILLEFGLAEDTELSFEVTESMTEEELREKIKEVYAEDKAPESSDAGEGEPQGGESGEDVAQDEGGENGEGEPQTFSVQSTYEQRRRVLYNALSNYSTADQTSCKYYFMLDFDDTYVYAYFEFYAVGENPKTGNMRIPYTIDGEDAALDMERNEEVRQVWLTKADEEKLSAEKAEFAELAKYKAERIEDDKKKAYAAVIAEFSDLGEIDEYKTVVKDAMTFESADALSEKLYAIRGRYASKPVKKPLAQVRIPVGFEAKSKQSEYDEFMQRYLAPEKK